MRPATRLPVLCVRGRQLVAKVLILISALSAAFGVSLAVTASEVPGQELRTVVESAKEPQTLRSGYRLWIPQDVARVCRVLAINQRGAGRYLYQSDDSWRRWASAYSAAVMLCEFEAMEARDNGAAQSMLTALRQFALSAGRPELADAKFVLWGHSMGGRVVQSFVACRPERVEAFVIALRGNASPPAFMEESHRAQQVPGLYLMGELDGKPADIYKHFLAARRYGGRRAWVWLPSQRHWPAGMSFTQNETTAQQWKAWAAPGVVQSFLSGVIERDKRAGDRTKPQRHKLAGWTVDAAGKVLELASVAADNRLQHSWFPNRAAAQQAADLQRQRAH